MLLRTAGISDWFCINPASGYKRDVVENPFLVCEAGFAGSLSRRLAMLCLLKAK